MTQHTVMLRAVITIKPNAIVLFCFDFEPEEIMAREGELHSFLYLTCPDHDGDTVLPPDPLRMLTSPPLNVLLGSHL